MALGYHTICRAWGCQVKLKPTRVAITGMANHSESPEKGLVWDPAANVYRLIASDLDGVPIMRKKPWSKWLVWPVAVAFMCLALTGATYWAMKIGLPIAGTVVPQAPPEPLQVTPAAIVAVAPIASIAATTATLVVATSEVAKPSVLNETKKSAAPDKTVALPKPPQPAKPPTKTASTNPGAKTPGQSPVAAQASSAAGTPPGKVALRAVEPQNTIVEAAPSATKGWAVAVEGSGVRYFDGKDTRLYKRGEVLPNGEKIVDVDEGSATFATDKGVRQIRSSKLKGNQP